MITYAFLLKDDVEKLLAKFAAKPESQWFHPFSYVEPYKIGSNTWGKIELVAVHDDKVCGFCAADIDRETMAITNIAMVKFVDGGDEEMAADIATVFNFLRRHFRHVRWSCCTQAPTYGIYLKIAAAHNGWKVGEIKEAYRLRDGTLADQAIFQVPGDSYPDGVTSLPPGGL